MASNREDYRKLTKLGQGSYYVTIPPEWIREMKWRERQKLSIKKIGDKIILEDWKAEK